jgi:hypothetical protein
MLRHWQMTHRVAMERPWLALHDHWCYARYGLKWQRAAQIGRHDATQEPHLHWHRHDLERQEVAQPAKRLTNLTADLGLAKEPTEGLPGWPGKLSQQIAKEPLCRQLPATNARVRLWCIH